MSCASCHKPKRTADDPVTPLNATDILVVDHNEVRALDAADWPADKHKLLVFYPETFTPVCSTEVGALNQWLPAFAELNCVVIAACADQAPAIRDWYTQEPLLADLGALTFSSYLLPARLGLVEGGRAKRASVFVMADAEVVKMEQFKNVGRSFEELHRSLWAYTQDTYCGVDWKSPLDNLAST